MAAMSLRGYWRTLIVFIACRPAMRMTKLTTIASTGRLMKRSVKDFMSIFRSRIDRLRIFLRLWREVVIDRYRHSIAQFENTGANDGLSGLKHTARHAFAGFQSCRHGHKVAPRLAYAHKLLPNG